MEQLILLSQHIYVHDSCNSLTGRMKDLRNVSKNAKYNVPNTYAIAIHYTTMPNTHFAKHFTETICFQPSPISQKPKLSKTPHFLILILQAVVLKPNAKKNPKVPIYPKKDKITFVTFFFWNCQTFANAKEQKRSNFLSYKSATTVEGAKSYRVTRIGNRQTKRQRFPPLKLKV